MRRAIIARWLRWLNCLRHKVTTCLVYYPCRDWPTVPANVIAMLCGTTGSFHVQLLPLTALSAEIPDSLAFCARTVRVDRYNRYKIFSSEWQRGSVLD